MELKITQQIIYISTSVIRNSKHKKKDLLRKIRELDLLRDSEPECMIGIRNNLTSTKLALFNKCKDYKSKHSIKYLWLNGNKNLMRKNDNSKIYAIYSESD